MPVWEIKEPLGVTPPPVKPIKRKIASIVPVTGIKAIDKLFVRRKWQKGEGRRHRQEVENKISIRKIRLLVDQVNDKLAACGILIHLVIALNKETWGLDIYDCSDNQQCLIIHAMPIDLDELSGLLNSLQREAGIMLDKVL